MWTLAVIIIALWFPFGWIGGVLPDAVLVVPLVLLLRERRRELRG
jgi:hypothetical protein